MRELRRILVAIKDPGAPASPALVKAGQLARSTGARLVLFNSVTTSVYVDSFAPAELAPGRVLAREVTLAKAGLGKLAGRVRRLGVKATVAVEVDFPAHEAILRYAARMDADLVVVDAHAGRRAIPGFIRLTDWELLRHSRQPVLVVKGARRYRRPVLLAAIDPMHANAKPGSLDRVILAAAERLRGALGGTLHVMHAYEALPYSVANARFMNSPIAAEFRSRSLAASRQAFARHLRGSAVPESNRHLVGQHPYAAIRQTAARVHSDIVVMGAISRSGVKRLLIGNTAERILSELQCDVLVVKPRGFRSRIPRARRGARVVANPVILPY